jgi:hypothetical protein
VRSPNFCIILTLTIFAIAAGTACGQDEMSAIKSEIAELRKELAAVRIERDALRKELASLKGGVSPGESGPPEGEINGVIWEISAFRPDGALITTQKFLALDGKIYHSKKELGTYTESGYRAKVEITRSDLPRANGTYQFVRITNNPPAYSGRFTNHQGDDLAVRLRIVRD